MLAHMVGERDVSAANKGRLSEEAKERNEPLMRTRERNPELNNSLEIEEEGGALGYGIGPSKKTLWKLFYIYLHSRF